MARRPELPGHLHAVFDAFILLSGGRGSNGFGGLDPIPTVDALAIAEIVEPIDPFRFLRIIRGLDTVVLNHYAEESERRGKERERDRTRKPRK